MDGCFILVQRLNKKVWWTRGASINVASGQRQLTEQSTLRQYILIDYKTLLVRLVLALCTVNHMRTKRTLIVSSSVTA